MTGPMCPAAGAALRFHTNTRQHLAFARSEVITRPFVMLVFSMTGITRTGHGTFKQRTRLHKIKIVHHPLSSTQPLTGRNGVDKFLIQFQLFPGATPPVASQGTLYDH